MSAQQTQQTSNAKAPRPKQAITEKPDYKLNLDAYNHHLMAIVNACKQVAKQWTVDNNVDFTNKAMVSAMNPLLELPGFYPLPFKISFVPKKDIQQPSTVDHYYINVRIQFPHK